MRKQRRFLAALLAAALLLGLAACGEKEETARKLDWQAAPAYLSEAVELPVKTGSLAGCCTDGESLYILAEEQEKPEATLCRVSMADGTAAVLEDYRGADIPEGAAHTIQGLTLAQDGTLWTYEAWAVSHYDLPEDFDEEREAKGKHFVGQDNYCCLRQLDPATGGELKSVDLSAAAEPLADGFRYDTVWFAVDGEGRIYLADNKCIAVLDGQGALLFTLEASLPAHPMNGFAGTALALLGDGSVAAVTVQSGGKREVRTIDPAARGWGQGRWQLPTGAEEIYPGFGGFLFLSCCPGRDKLYAWEKGAEEITELLKLSVARLDSGLACVAPIEGGRLAALTLRYEGSGRYDGNLRLNLLSPTEKLEDSEKTKVTYGAFGVSGDMQARVNRFNQDNEQYHIEILDYFDGADPWGDQRAERMDAAKKRLFADIAAGNAPDIWDSSLPLDLYARKGMFEDLWPWIENDPDLGREKVMEHVLDCAALDGKLYQVCGSFLINTAVGMPDVVGDRTAWTMEDLLAAYDTLEPGAEIFCGYVSSRGLLYSLINEDLDRYVDWDTGACRFDSEEFKALLELCSRVRREGDFSGNDGGAGLREGRTLLWDIQLMRPSEILYAEALCAGPADLEDYGAYLNANHVYPTLIDEQGNWREKEAMYCYALQDMERSKKTGYLYGLQDEYHMMASDAAFGALRGGGYVSYIGYPTQGGAGSSFYTYDNLSMSASCQHKEGAWAFIRQVLLPGGSQRTETSSFGTSSYSPGFPVNKADFDETMSPKWMVNKSGELMLDADGERIEKPGDGLVATGYPCSLVLFNLAPTQPQLERFMELYNAIDHITSSEYDLLDIIIDEAEVYWAGDRPLDETAKLIQSRAGIYVNEQR